jgi:hypothetical protein
VLLQLDGIMWLLVLLGPFVLLQRKVHFEIQAVLFLLIRRLDVVYVMFSLIFLPGVVIHELSHFLVARLLGVRTGKFSIIPRNMNDGRLQLGSVETEKVDILRDSLIGMAPLILGGFTITLIARMCLGFDQIVLAIADTGLSGLATVFHNLANMPDFWLWFYLLLTISSTMLPSESDRRAWLPLIVVVTILLLIGLLVGVGPWMVVNLAPVVNQIFRSLAVVFGLSILAHLALLLPVIFLRMSLSRILRLTVR